LDTIGQGFYQLSQSQDFLYSILTDRFLIQSALTLMLFPSLQKPSSVRENIFAVCLFIFLVVSIQGCSDSEEKASPNTQESPPPKTAVVVPEDSKAPLGTGEVESGPLPATSQELSRLEAQEELDHAKQAVEKGEQLLHRAPKGKGSDLALSALDQDLDSARTLLQTSQTHFGDQKFEMAQTEARQATEKAAAVSQHIEQAIKTVNVSR
jgi:hypothetical protein